MNIQTSKVKIDHSSYSRPQSPMNEILDLKYTPYVKFVRRDKPTDDGTIDIEESNFYFVISFLSDENYQFLGVKEGYRNDKIVFDVSINTENVTKSSLSFSQIIVDADSISLDISRLIRKQVNVDYYVEIFDENPSILNGGPNPGGGSTNPQDPYPPAFTR
jgi:hypothetical protein